MDKTTTPRKVQNNSRPSWTMDGQYNIMTVHVVVDDASTSIELIQKIREVLLPENIHHVTIEIGLPEEVCGLKNGCF